MNIAGGRENAPGSGWQAAVVVAAAVVVYLNALGNDFVWDDLPLIVANPAIKDWRNIFGLFALDLFPHGLLSSYYRPLQAVTYAVDYQLWGLHPLGFHLTSVLLHAAVAFACYRFLNAWLEDRRVAFGATLLFAVHPIHTEAVTYVSGRSDPLSALLVLLALLCFLRDRRQPSLSWRFLSLGCFFAALLAREAAMVLPLLVLLVGTTAASTRQARTSTLVLVAPYFVVLIAYLALRGAVVGLTAPETAVATIPLRYRLLTMARVVVQYVALLVVPTPLHMERRVDPSLSPADPLALGALALLVAAAVVAWRSRTRARVVAAGASWFAIALLPLLNIVPLSTFMAEHWLYLPSIGIFVIVGWLAAKAVERGWRQPVATATIIALAAYGGLTMRRNLDWRDGITLYRATLRHAPYSIRAWSNLGHSLQESGDLPGAREAYERALQIAERGIATHLAGPYAGRSAEIYAAYLRALAAQTDLADTHNNLGNILQAEGKLAEAEATFRRALALNPRHASAYSNLGLTLEALGRAEEARQAFETALRLDPSHAAAHSNLGNFHFRRDMLAEAERHYLEALRLDPDYPEALNNLGSVYFRRGDLARAEDAYRNALRLDPGRQEVQRNLEIVLRARNAAP